MGWKEHEERKLRRRGSVAQMEWKQGKDAGKWQCDVLCVGEQGVLMGEQHVVLGGPQCSGEDSAIVCELDVVIYISLIDGLCKMGELDFSIEMQILMVEKGMAPYVFTYISLIQGLSDAGLMDEALGLM